MTTPNLQLPEVPEAILESSEEINEGFDRLDAITQLAVIDRGLAYNQLPDNAAQGTRYLLAEGYRAGHIAYRSSSGWMFLVPRPGWRVRVLDEGIWLIYSGTAWIEDTSAGGKRTIGAAWANSSGAIATPVNEVYVRSPITGTIVGVSVTTAGGTGSCVIDIRKDTYANFPPQSADSICASSKPTISSAAKYEDESLSEWTTTVSEGDVLAFVLESAASFTYICVQLLIRS